MSDVHVCIEEGCALPARARQRCGAHYQKWRRENLNTVSAPDSDDRMGFASRYAALLDEAPDGLLNPAERDLLVSVVFLAAATARGVLPMDPEIRRVALHGAVDRIVAAVPTE